MLQDDLQSSVNQAVKGAVAAFANFGSIVLNTTPISFENVKFAPPAKAHWLGVTVIVGEGRQRSLGKPGDRRIRKVGVVKIQVVVPAGEGTGLADDITRKIENALSGVTLYGVTYRTAVPGQGRQVGEEWQVTVTIPFHADRFG